MANFIEKTLEDGEKVIYKGRLHWSYNIGLTLIGYVFIVLAIVFALVPSMSASAGSASVYYVVAVAFIIIGLAVVGWGYFIRSKSEFAITTTRFIQKDGILNIHMTEIPLFKIETVNFYQTFIQRFVNTGEIELVGSGGTNHTVKYIQQPMKVRKVLNSSINESKDKGE